MKYSFRNDYSEGAHPSIIETLLTSNDSQENGYGDDRFSLKAADLIRKLCQNEKAEIYFVAGGTLANLLVISAMLKPYESVISADTGHINSNETGAVEHTGFKIHSVKSEDGKLSPELILPVLESHINFPHQVKSKLVYISNSTELGTVYTKNELQSLSDLCKANDLFLFMDGARLGHALCSEKNDLTMADIAELTDVFYIGGTKNGALFGEAVVVNNPELLSDFPFHLKQKGALLAKGRVLGVQFMILFQDNLYFELAAKANRQALKIKEAFKKKGFGFLTETSTNQIFPVLPYSVIDKLLQNYEFYLWKKVDNENAAIRLITSWKTEDELVERFISEIERL